MPHEQINANSFIFRAHKQQTTIIRAPSSSMSTIRMYYSMLSQFNADTGRFNANPLKSLAFAVPSEREAAFCTWKEMRAALEQVGKKRARQSTAGTDSNEPTEQKKNDDGQQRFETDGYLAYHLNDAINMLTAHHHHSRRHSNHEWIDRLRALVDVCRPHTLLPDDLLFAKETVVIHHVPSGVERAVLQNKECRPQSLRIPEELPENVRLQIVIKQNVRQPDRLQRDQVLCKYCYPSAAANQATAAAGQNIPSPEDAEADQDEMTTATDLFKDVERAARNRRRAHWNENNANIDQGAHAQDTCLQTLLRYDSSRARNANTPGVRRVKYQTAFGIPRSQLRVATDEEVTEGFAMLSPGQSRYVVRKNFAIPR